MKPESTFDYLRAPVVWLWNQTGEEYLEVEELHDWADARARKCGHTRDFVQSCRMCQGTMMVVNVLDSGASVVRLLPQR